MNPRQVLLIARATGLLLRGNPGEAIIAELRDWGGPNSRQLGRAVSFLALALGLGIAGAMIASELTTVVAPMQSAHLPN